MGELGFSTSRAIDNVLLVLEPLVGTAHRFSGMGDFAFGYGKDNRGKEVKEGLENR